MSMGATLWTSIILAQLTGIFLFFREGEKSLGLFVGGQWFANSFVFPWLLVLLGLSVILNW